MQRWQLNQLHASTKFLWFRFGNIWQKFKGKRLVTPYLLFCYYLKRKCPHQLKMMQTGISATYCSEQACWMSSQTLSKRAAFFSHTFGGRQWHMQNFSKVTSFEFCVGFLYMAYRIRPRMNSGVVSFLRSSCSTTKHASSDGWFCAIHSSSWGTAYVTPTQRQSHPSWSKPDSTHATSFRSWQ